MKVARFRCMCGSHHTVPFDRALDALSVAHWRCTDCKRRFVLTHQPPEGFTPIYLDPGVRSVEPRETGATNPGGTVNTAPVPPPAIIIVCVTPVAPIPWPQVDCCDRFRRMPMEISVAMSDEPP